MMDDFLIRSLLAGIGVALLAGPMGSFVVWRKMAFFGDALAHSALLGVALGVMFNTGHIIGIMLFAIVFSVLVAWLQYQHTYSTDTILGIVAHSSLALGIIVLTVVFPYVVDLMALFVGDILAVTKHDLLWIYGCVVAGYMFLLFYWRPLLLLTLNEDVAKVEGVNVGVVRLAFMLLMSLMVAIAVKVVGILLITALLVIPAATVRVFSRTPEQMALFATLTAAFAVVVGVFVADYLDAPVSPSVVMSAA